MMGQGNQGGGGTPVIAMGSMKLEVRNEKVCPTAAWKPEDGSESSAAVIVIVFLVIFCGCACVIGWYMKSKKQAAVSQSNGYQDPDQSLNEKVGA